MVNYQVGEGSRRSETECPAPPVDCEGARLFMRGASACQDAASKDSLLVLSWRVQRVYAKYNPKELIERCTMYRGKSSQHTVQNTMLRRSRCVLIFLYIIQYCARFSFPADAGADPTLTLMCWMTYTVTCTAAIIAMCRRSCSTTRNPIPLFI